MRLLDSVIFFLLWHLAISSQSSLSLSNISSLCLLKHYNSIAQFQVGKILIFGNRSKLATSKNRKNLTLIVFIVKASNLPFDMKGNWDFRIFLKGKHYQSLFFINSFLSQLTLCLTQLRNYPLFRLCKWNFNALENAEMNVSKNAVLKGKDEAPSSA